MSLNAPEGFGRVFVALSVCYAVAFVGVVAEVFWGRWFATGLAWSGIMMAIAVLVLLGWMPQMAVFGGMHLVVAVSLMGKKMAARYDMQEAWRTRFQIDEFGVARLRKAVTSAAASLPSMIMWVLAPKEEGLAAVGAVAALVLTVAGLRGLVRLRSWGVLSLAGAGALVAVSGHVGLPFLSGLGGTDCLGFFGSVPAQVKLAWYGEALGPTLAFVLLAIAVVPFAGAIVRYLRRPA